jgi:YcxB-like protein
MGHSPEQDNEVITIEGSFQERDYWHATRHLRNRTPRIRFAYSFFILMPWVVILYSYFNEPEKWTTALFAVPLVVYLIGFILMPQIDRALFHRQLSSNPSAFGFHSYVFSHDGMNLAGSLSNANLSWDAIVKASESKDALFFYTGSHTAHFLPKRFISSAAEDTRLRAMIKNKLGKRSNVS